MYDFCIKKALIPLLFFCFSTTGYSLARTLYVSPSGDDNSPVQDGAVLRTINRAAEILSPGDTLIIKNGTYQENGVLIRNVKGTAENPVLIRGESLDAIIAGSGSLRDAFRVEECSHFTIDRLTVRNADRGGIVIRFCDNMTVTGCLVNNNDKWGIYTSFTNNVKIENNECHHCGLGTYVCNSADHFVLRGNRIHHNPGNGMHFNGDPEMTGGDGVLNYGLIENNILYENGQGGGGAINMTHVHDVLVRNNLAYNNYANGITVYQDNGTFEQASKRVLLTGNTVYFKPHSGRYAVNIHTTTEKVLVAGNILVGGHPTYRAASSHMTTIKGDYNVIWGVDSTNVAERDEQYIGLADWRRVYGIDTHSVFADPLFAGGDSVDFRLDESSPAVDAGMPPDSIRAVLESMGGFEWISALLDSLPRQDIRQWPRPQLNGCDAGAYELSTAETGMYDYNTDGRLNIGDAVCLLLGIRGNLPVRVAMDINHDSRITLDDVLGLLSVMLSCLWQ